MVGNNIVGWMLQFYALATSKVIYGWVPTCVSIPSWQLHSVIHWETRASAAWPDIPLSRITLTLSELVLAYSNNAERLVRKQQVLLFLSHRFNLTMVQVYGFESHDLPKRETDAQLIHPFRVTWEIACCLMPVNLAYWYNHIFIAIRPSNWQVSQESD